MMSSRVTFGWDFLYSCSLSAAEVRRSWSFVFCSSERFRSPAMRLSSFLIASACSAVRLIVLLLMFYSLLNRDFDFGSRSPSGQIVHSPGGGHTGQGRGRANLIVRFTAVNRESPS